MNAQGPALPPPGEEQHLGDVDAPAPGSAPSGGDQLHLPDQHWPQLMLMLQEGTSTGFCHCSRTGVSPKYPSVGHQTYRRSLRQLRTPMPLDRVPYEPQEIHRGPPCPSHHTGLVHGNAILVPLCASRVLHWDSAQPPLLASHDGRDYCHQKDVHHCRGCWDCSNIQQILARDPRCLHWGGAWVCTACSKWWWLSIWSCGPPHHTLSTGHVRHGCVHSVQDERHKICREGGQAQHGDERICGSSVTNPKSRDMMRMLLLDIIGGQRKCGCQEL